jgi:hypothetical protein
MDLVPRALDSDFNIFRIGLEGRIECQGGGPGAQSLNIFRAGLGGRIECQGGGPRAQSSTDFRLYYSRL